MTRTALATPEEPDDPSGQIDDAFVRYMESVAEVVAQGKLTARPATLADTDGFFAVQRSDGSFSTVMMQCKSHRVLKLVDGPRRDIFAEEILKSLHASHSSKPTRLARVSPQKLTNCAVFIAGRERAALADEWRSHLFGETDGSLPVDCQVREAAGFVVAAVRYRLQDAADFAWRPVDSVLASRKLSNLVVFFATLAIAAFYIHQGGLDELADNLEGVGVVWGAAYGAIYLGRTWRDVKPPEHKQRKDAR